MTNGVLGDVVAAFSPGYQLLLAKLDESRRWIDNTNLTWHAKKEADEVLAEARKAILFQWCRFPLPKYHQGLHCSIICVTYCATICLSSDCWGRSSKTSRSISRTSKIPCAVA